MKMNFLSRRNFLKSSTLAVTGASTFLSGAHLLASSPGQIKEAAKVLKLAGYDFPRITALASGKAKIAGAETQFTPGRVGDMNTDLFDGPQTYDISEVGLHPFILAYAIGGFRDYTLLPIFPLRVFRHKSIFIRTDRGITRPQDLRGKSIASPGYSSTSLTWIRGVLQDEYGVSPNEVEWVMSGKDSSANISGKVSEYESLIPDGLNGDYSRIHAQWNRPTSRRPASSQSCMRWRSGNPCLRNTHGWRKRRLMRTQRPNS